MQANLRKMTTATASILKDLKPSSVLLLTEPYISKHKRIPNIPKSHKALLSATGRPRSAIVMPVGLYDMSMRLGQFSSPDITTARITLDSFSFIISSAYLDINLPVDNSTTRDLFTYCNQHKIPLLFCADTNARNTLWGDRITNTRGRTLADIIASFSLHIVNRGSAPTYNSKLGSSIIDLTLVNDYALNLIKEWSSSFNNTVSDHARISFFIDLIPPTRQPYRNPKDCDWKLFQESVTKTLSDNPFRFSPTCDKPYLNKLNKFITDTLLKAFNTACPIKYTTRRTSVPWWTLELTAKRKQVRIMHRKARKHKTDHLWNLYKEGLKEFKKLIKASKHKSWKDFTDKISSIPSASRLHKTLKSLDIHNSQLGSLKKPDGKHTSTPIDTLHALADALLPNDNPPPTTPATPNDYHEEIINKVITPDRLKKVCSDMAPNKSPGPDAIRLSMLNASWDSISPCIIHLLKHSLRLGITPDPWHRATGVIIAKPHKEDYTDVRSYRIISLTSTLQKILEKLIVWYIESDIGLKDLTSDNQHGFKRNFSTDSAIHKITSKIEYSLSAGNQALGLFLDIEGAFDNISFQAIKTNMEKSGIPPTISNWIYFMVSNRTITLTLNGISITRIITRGCPQGGVLSPFLWNLTLNDLLSHQQLDKSFLQAFADDLAILVGGIDIPTIRSICQSYLRIIDHWCSSIGVKLSTLKTKLIMFTRKRKWTLDKPLSLHGDNIELVTSVKYLGITLDSKLMWRPHIESACNKAIRTLHSVRSACCKKWGLKPHYTLWIYEQIIIPAITHGCVVWSHLLENNKSLSNLLTHVQRTALLMVTGAINSSPSCYLNVLANLLPLDLKVRETALKTTLRLKLASNFSPGFLSGKIISHAHYQNELLSKTIPPLNLLDTAPTRLNLNLSYSINISIC